MKEYAKVEKPTQLNDLVGEYLSNKDTGKELHHVLVSMLGAYPHHGKPGLYEAILEEFYTDKGNSKYCE